MTRMMLMGAALAMTLCVQAVTLDLASAKIDVRGKDFGLAAQELEKHLRLIAGERTGQGSCQFVVGLVRKGRRRPARLNRLPASAAARCTSGAMRRSMTGRARRVRSLPCTSSSTVRLA